MRSASDTEDDQNEIFRRSISAEEHSSPSYPTIDGTATASSEKTESSKIQVENKSSTKFKTPKNSPEESTKTLLALSKSSDEDPVLESFTGSLSSEQNRQKQNLSSSFSSKQTQFDDGTQPIERALLELAPRKAKRMFERRKRVRESGGDDTSGLWETPPPGKRGKSHSLKQIQRLSNELEQVLGVLCNGDKQVAVDVLAHLMTKRHLGAELFQNVEKKMKNMPERSLDNRIVDGIIGFFEHHHTRGTRPTEAARAVDAVMVACCWDICDNDELPSSPDNPIKLDFRRKILVTEKRISNSAIIERLGVNRSALKRARAKAKSIKIEEKAHYKPDDRKHRKDKGFSAKVYREVKRNEEATGSPREKSEYHAVDVLTNLDKENILKKRSSGFSPQSTSPSYPSQTYGKNVPHLPTTEAYPYVPSHTSTSTVDMNAQQEFNRFLPPYYSQATQNWTGSIQRPMMGVPTSRPRHITLEERQWMPNPVQAHSPSMRGFYDNHYQHTQPHEISYNWPRNNKPSPSMIPGENHESQFGLSPTDYQRNMDRKPSPQPSMGTIAIDSSSRMHPHEAQGIMNPSIIELHENRAPQQQQLPTYHSNQEYQRAIHDFQNQQIPPSNTLQGTHLNPSSQGLPTMRVTDSLTGQISHDFSREVGGAYAHFHNKESQSKEP